MLKLDESATAISVSLLTLYQFQRGALNYLLRTYLPVSWIRKLRTMRLRRQTARREDRGPEEMTDA